MDLFIQKMLDSIAQILLFSLIPFVWWCITAKGKTSFFQWIGLKRLSGLEGDRIALWIAGTTIVFLAVSVSILYSVRDIETAASEFLGSGMKALPAILVYAVLNTSFPEEILFRGFLLKRLSGRFGFSVGNVIQSALFGSLHGAMFFERVGMTQAILIVGFTGGIAWSMGYINEQKAGGSILPSWCIHAIANLFSGICSAFLIF